MVQTNAIETLNINNKNCYSKLGRNQTNPVEYIEPELLESLYWGNNYSVTEIGKLFDCSPSTIFKRLVKNNIETKSVGNQRGHKPNPTSFKKHHIPWNKGKSHISGKQHYNWNGGTTPLIRRLRTRINLMNLHNTVFERDDYTCWYCGNRGVELHSHHLKSFSEIFSEFVKLHVNITDDELFELSMNYSEFYDTTNMITLCSECHHNLHSDGLKYVKK